MTTEALNSQPPDARGPSLSENPQLFTALMWTLLALLAGDETTIPSRPLSVLYHTALAAPFIILAGIALRRRFFSAPMPQRWPSGTSEQHRLEALGIVTMLLAVLLFGVSIGMRTSVGRHNPRYTGLHDAAYFLLSWGYVLVTYIADRKPLPPPRKSEYIWADLKPIQSDNWGNRGPLAR